MAPDNAILVVEDDAGTREALALILEGRGYTVCCAANGQEAVNYLHQGGRPCLILLDLMMPVMDGWRFRQVQCTDPDLAAIPVVLVSADSALPERAASLGVEGYLEKPVEADSLLATVRQHC